MGYYRRVGEVPRKRHTLQRGADGGVLIEELMGSEGFSADSALLYHRGSPSALVAIEAIDDTPASLTPNQPLSPWHLRTTALTDGCDIVRDRVVLLGNDAVRISIARGAQSSELYRNAANDELVYVQSGNGVVESVFVSLFHDNIWIALRPSAASADGLRSTDRSRKRWTTSSVVEVDNG